MVNAKNVAFKVNKQPPLVVAPSQAFATVINCRRSNVRAGPDDADAAKLELFDLSKAFKNANQRQKRKRSNTDTERGSKKAVQPEPAETAIDDTISTLTKMPSSCRTPSSEVVVQTHQPPKPLRLKLRRTFPKSIDLDCWFTILSFSNPGQLLQLRGTLASCYRFLRDNPKLWQHSRNYFYGGSLPDPPSELNEFQYADLRHGNGCMACHTPSTRKTYWAFLRRWCRPCLQKKIIKGHELRTCRKDLTIEDLLTLAKCLSSATVDSWGNFVGVSNGQLHGHSVKTVYVKADVDKLMSEYAEHKSRGDGSWTTAFHEWVLQRQRIVEQRRSFAREMEQWEDSKRHVRSAGYMEKKQARKDYFKEKAAQLSPPIHQSQLDDCPSYRRAIAIPKDPNMISWLQLKPKLEKEAAELKSKGHLVTLPPIASITAFSPDSDDEEFPVLPSIAED